MRTATCSAYRGQPSLLQQRIVTVMVPLNVSRSTMAAHSRGSVNVFVQPPNDSFEAIATLFFSRARSGPGRGARPSPGQPQRSRGLTTAGVAGPSSVVTTAVS